MLACHGCYSNGTWKGKVVPRYKVMVWREAEGVSHRVNVGGGAIFMRELIPQLSLKIAFIFRPILV